MTVLILLVATGARALAQRPVVTPPAPARTFLLRADNDAFDFWQLPWNRPDEDYTSGVRIVVRNAWRPWWASHLWTHLQRCRGTAAPCTTSSAWIGQNIYTAERDSDTKLMTVGARQSAGWLYYGEEFRRVAPRRSDRVEVTLGVTGPAAMAQYTQKLAHNAAPAFNKSIDWSHQLPFEPGVMVAYEHDELIPVAAAGPVSLQLIPAVIATAGNVLTQGTGRLQARLGINLRNPWVPANVDAPLELAFTASTAGNAVARNLFLDGSTFRHTPHVGHEPLYAERELGVTLTGGALYVEYRGVFDGRTYATGRPHAWASMVLGWTVVR
jgi:hypothetical protein